MQQEVTTDQIRAWKFPHQITADLSDLHLLDAYKGVSFLADKIDRLGREPDNTDPGRMSHSLFMRFMSTQMGYNLALIEKYLGIHIKKEDYLAMHKHAYPENPVGDPALNHGEACVIARSLLEARAVIEEQAGSLSPFQTDEVLHRIDQALHLLNVKEGE